MMELIFPAPFRFYFVFSILFLLFKTFDLQSLKTKYKYKYNIILSWCGVSNPRMKALKFLLLFSLFFNFWRSQDTSKFATFTNKLHDAIRNSVVPVLSHLSSHKGHIQSVIVYADGKTHTNQGLFHEFCLSDCWIVVELSAVQRERERERKREYF